VRITNTTNAAVKTRVEILGRAWEGRDWRWIREKCARGINAILDGKSVGKGNANTINKTVARSFVEAIVVGKLARSAQLGSARGDATPRRPRGQ